MTTTVTRTTTTTVTSITTTTSTLTTTPTTTITSTTLGPKGFCVLYGDPHILTFDRVPIFADELTFTTDGTWPLVNSERISIKGTYGRVRRNRGYLLSVSVDGPFLQGHTLNFGLGEEEVTWDGVPILQGRRA